jgi:hypothetical protein
MLIQVRFWLENKITENQRKIAETIYTPFSTSLYLTCSDCSATFREKIQRKIAEIS